MEKISSIKNDAIKNLRKLYKKKYRKERKQFILEGLRLIRGSYKAGANIESIFLTDEFYNKNMSEDFLHENNDKLIFVTKKLINKTANTESPQEIIAVVNEPESTIDQILSKDLVLILNRIQDPGNMGTIIRTAAAAGFQSIIITKGSVDIYNLKVIRSTAGAIYSIPIIKDVKLKELLPILKNNDRKIYAADIDTDQYYNKIDYSKPLGLIIGNEARGIRDELLKIADKTVKIPLRGSIESLNAGIAAGILMYKITENILNDD